MKTLINKTNPTIRITAPEITTDAAPNNNYLYVYWIPAINEIYSPIDWNLVEEEPEFEHRRKDTIYFLETAKTHYADTSELEKCIEWLKGLQPTEGIKGNLEEIPSNVDLERAFKQFSDILDKWEKHAILGMKVGASAYHQGKIALICDLRDWIKEQTKKQ